MELFNAHQHLEALPLLEVLAKADPKDRLVQERLAIALLTKSVTVGADEGRALRRRGRSILQDMSKTGPLSDLGGVLLGSIPEDGGLPDFSKKSDAQVAMKEGEAAFARRDFDAARRAYQRALTFDPTLYHAPLFVGDTYFVEGRLEQARTWFRRAILIDPNKEVAHRYLADAMAKAGHLAAARLCYIDAVVAQPYVRQPWLALAGWARANQVTLSHPRIVPEDIEGAGDAKKADQAKVAAEAAPGPTTAARTGGSIPRPARPGRRTVSGRPSRGPHTAIVSPRKRMHSARWPARSPTTSRPDESSNRIPASPISSSSTGRGCSKPTSSSPGPMTASRRITTRTARPTAARSATTSRSTSPRSVKPSRMKRSSSSDGRFRMPDRGL